MKAKILYIFIAIFLVVSCSSPFKKKKSDTFLKDSDFLKQGRTVEEFEEKAAPIEVETIKRIKSKVKKDKVSKKISEKDSSLIESGKSKVTEATKAKSVDVKRAPSFPFRVGEEVTLSATYLGMEAGKISIGVDSFKKLEGKKVYHFYAIGKTSSVFSLFYKVKNKIESLWDPEIKRPKSLAFDALETKQKYKTRVYFDWKKKKADFLEEGWSKKKGDYKEKKTWDLKTSGQDIVSSIFYTRTLPLKVGETYNVTVFEDAKVIRASFKVDRKEMLRTRIGKLKTLVLKPSFTTDGKFKKVGDISVWLTDDEYRQVVRIESKIKIGTVIAKLYSLKRPKD